MAIWYSIRIQEEIIRNAIRMLPRQLTVSSSAGCYLKLAGCHGASFADRLQWQRVGGRMMIDAKMRRALSAFLCEAKTGVPKRHQFDDAFYFRFTSTDDRAVREIATYCYSLYQPGRGRSNELASADRAGVAGLIDTAILFLKTDLEYEWPTEPLSLGRRFTGGFLAFMVIPVLMSLIAFAIPVEILASQVFLVPFTAISSVALFASLAAIAMKPAIVPLRSKQMIRRGDYGVWPFYRRGDYAIASR